MNEKVSKLPSNPYWIPTLVKSIRYNFKNFIVTLNNKIKFIQMSTSIKHLGEYTQSPTNKSSFDAHTTPTVTLSHTSNFFTFHIFDCYYSLYILAHTIPT